MGTDKLERLKEQLKVLGLRKTQEIFEEEAEKAIKTNCQISLGKDLGGV